MTVHRRLSNPGPGAPAGSRLALVLSLILAGPGLLSGPISASTERVNVSSSGKQANNYSENGLALSGDGRFVAFDSRASNLVPGDWNGYTDFFVHDRVTGTTERVNVSPSGAEANGESAYVPPAISADGRFVAFRSGATNLAPGKANPSGDIFVHDRVTRLNERVSVSLNGAMTNSWSGNAELSADGRFVVFESGASNLVLGDTNGVWDIFVRDRAMGTTELVNVSSDGELGNQGGNAPAISADGRFVAFQSDSDNLVPGDTNGWTDVFVRDRVTGSTERISVNGYTYAPSISADGRFLAFVSDASNLVPDDTNNVGDIFVHDRVTGTTERVNVSSTGVQANNVTWDPAISADGRFAAFTSDASNLVPGDTNQHYDIFVHDRVTGTTERVNVSSAGVQANNVTWYPAISADGRSVGFLSYADNLVPGDTDGYSDIFVNDRTSNSGAAYLSLASLPDLDGNAAPEITALRTGPTSGVATAVIRDSLTKAPLGDVIFDSPGSTPLGLTALADVGGAPALAVLFARPNGPGLVQVTDARSGERLATPSFFGEDWRLRAIAAPADGDSADALAVLAEKADGTQASIQVTQAATQVQLRRIGLPLSSGEHYLGLASLPSINDNASPELAALRQLANGMAQVIIKDSATGAFVHTISFQSPGNTPLGVASVASPGGTSQLAVLWRKPNGRGLVQVRDAATRAWVREVPFFGAPWEVTALTVLDSNQDGVSEIAVLARHDEGTRAAIQIRDAETKQPLRWIELPME